MNIELLDNIQHKLLPGYCHFYAAQRYINQHTTVQYCIELLRKAVKT